MKKYLFLIAAFAAISAGCKKDRQEKPSCRISKLFNRFGIATTVSYNADGKYEKLEDGFSSITTTISYSGNVIAITRAGTTTGTYRSRTRLVLNSNGMIDTQRDEYYNATATSTSSAVTAKYEYAGTQLTKSTVVDSFYSQQSVSIVTANYTWKDGNLVTATAGGNVLNYEYYPDLLFQEGDMEAIYRLIRGYSISLIIRNKNLTKSRNTGQFGYEFEADGRVKATKYNGGIDYRIEYECK